MGESGRRGFAGIHTCFSWAEAFAKEIVKIAPSGQFLSQDQLPD
jgi:hypothetical protein